MVLDPADAVFEFGVALEAVPEVIGGDDAFAVGILQGGEFLRLGLVGVGGKAVADEEIPDGLAGLAGVTGLELRVTAPVEFGIGLAGFGTVAPADELDDALALIDPFAQDAAEAAMLGAGHVLILRIEAHAVQESGREPARGLQFLADGGEEDDGALAHGAMDRNG